MTLNGNFDQNIIQNIKNNHLKPKPRWTFLLKEYTIWSLSFALIAVGGLAFSVIIYLVRNNDWDIYDDVYGNMPRFLLLTIPYVWIFMLVVFYFAAQYYLMHTKQGYRYHAWIIAAVTIPLSFVLGAGLYGLGAAELIDSALLERVPYYQDLNRHAICRWQKPEIGMLAGEIADFDESDVFIIYDPVGKLWNVDGKNSASVNIPVYQIGIRVRIIGSQEGENMFHADKILIAQPPIERFFKNKNMHEKIPNPQILPGVNIYYNPD